MTANIRFRPSFTMPDDGSYLGDNHAIREIDRCCILYDTLRSNNKRRGFQGQLINRIMHEVPNYERLHTVVALNLKEHYRKMTPDVHRTNIIAERILRKAVRAKFKRDNGHSYKKVQGAWVPHVPDEEIKQITGFGRF